MKFLLDTSAISEPQKSAPNAGYMGWLLDQDTDDLATSALTFGELRRGVVRLEAGRRRTELSAWVAEGLTRFGLRILPVDLAVTMVWADVWALHRRLGHPVGPVDELIAATAISSGLTVVTNNRRDFEASGCELLVPWSE